MYIFYDLIINEKIKIDDSNKHIYKRRKLSPYYNNNKNYLLKHCKVGIL